MDNKEAVISKIRKVLALAINNPSEEEGENAMLTAQRLMAENNIVSADIKEVAETKEIIKGVGNSVKKSVWWHGNLALIIANNFRCYVYISKNRSSGTTQTIFLGLKGDVELAKEVYTYAITLIDHTSKKYAQENKHLGTTTGIKNQYILGFLAGLKSKFDEQVKNNNWGLIIVKDTLVTQAHAKLHLGFIKPSRMRASYNDTARDAGYIQGKQFTPIAGSLTGV